MILKIILAITMLSLIISLITLHRVFGLKGLIIYELSVFEQFMRDRVNGFLDVFRKAKSHNDGQQ